MRIWDINPGYLNRQSLLGEHRELHGLVSIMVNGKKGYSKHPETLRWIGHGWAIRQRHRLLAAEMSLRGFTDKTPVLTRSGKHMWPKIYIDQPFRQFQLLANKYRHKEQGRIYLPNSAQQLWSQHKHSVLARDTRAYKKYGILVSTMKPRDDVSELALKLTELLRKPPSTGGLRNTLLHMWGYVDDQPSTTSFRISTCSLNRLLKEIQHRSMANNISYLVSSTALSELMLWAPTDKKAT